MHIGNSTVNGCVVPGSMKHMALVDVATNADQKAYGARRLRGRGGREEEEQRMTTVSEKTTTCISATLTVISTTANPCSSTIRGLSTHTNISTFTSIRFNICTEKW